MANSTVDFVVAGDPERARATLAEALQYQKFRIAWTTPEQGTAERGSVGANLVGGAFAQYFKINLQLCPVEGGNTLLRISRGTSGVMGGVPGMIRVRRQFTSLTSELASTFNAAGVLVAAATP
jgi:hypothetical protein